MSRSDKVQAIIEEAVSEVFEAALPNLRAQIISRAVEELQTLEPSPASLPADLLNAATSSIQESASQAEILRHLLEGAARFCGRAALFVIKMSSMTGWLGIGFENNDEIKSFNLSASAGLAERAIQGRAPVSGTAEEFDSGFVSTLSAPVDGNCLVLPLVVKEKVAALIYADAGKLPDSTVDLSALTLLCRFTALWLELVALRKTGITAPAEEGHAHPVAAAAPTPVPPAPVAADADATASASPEESDSHKKARRFAKLLVDEIKLYNQNKVAEGKQNRDLYDRLKEDIEKSRAAYDKKFTGTPASSVHYFTQELIRVLADNDVTLMGGNFPH
ncbi:MAG TPA: hypothetical protein VI636_20060 [Candidatus Angelobacter sp.]